jgi:hypothetical protein
MTMPFCIHTSDTISLSTAPWDPETHWKQTVIMLGNSTTFEAGDIMGWEFIMEKSDDTSSSRAYRLQLRLLEEDEEHPVPCLCGSVKCELVRHFISTHPDPSTTDNPSS